MSKPYFDTPMDAELAFYDAFQRRDLDAMMNVWADEESIICIHPMGPRLGGPKAIAQSWEEIFSGATPMRFELTEVEYTRDDVLAVHCLYENIEHGPRLRERAVVLATNVYKMTDNGWRMVLHHASPGTAEVTPQARVASEGGPQRLH